MLKLSWRQAAAWRARRQYLDRRAAAGSMLAVASRLCGLHAQLMSSAELSAWARVEKLDRRAVPRALWEERTLVKTWAMRGTLHLLPSDELPLWCAALGTNPHYLRPAVWKRNFGITIEDLDRLTEAVAKALEGRMMTREELAQEVKALPGSGPLPPGIPWNTWGTTLRPAAFAGHLCFAPSLGQRVRFTRPDTWLASPLPKIDSQIAAAEVTRRYLAAYGPAAHQDLARWWGGGGVASARQWIAALAEEVTPVEIDGAPAWMLAADARKLRRLPPMRSVRLLPAFDPYIVAASWHADKLLPGDLRSRVFRPQGWISPVLLVNGFMQGTWRHTIQGSHIEVTIEPFVQQPAWVRRAASEEAERLAAFLGGPLTLSWKS